MNFKKHIKLIFLTVSVLFFVVSCKGWDEDDINSTFDEAKNPETSFTQTETIITEGNTITFTNTSTNSPKYFLWSFPGGNPSSSIEENPTVLYDVKGEFDVILKTRNEFGADEVIMEKLITVEGKPIPYLSNYNFSGNLNDEGSNAIMAISNYGDPTYVTDRNGITQSALLSPGLGANYLSIPGYKGVSGNGTRTLMAWFRTDAGTSRKTIISYGTNSSGKMFNVMVDNDRIRIEGGASSLKSFKTGLKDGLWHHVAVSFDPADGDKLSNVKIYIDGVLDPGTEDGNGSFNSATTVIDTDAAGSDVLIGSAIYSSYPFIGEIDDVRILDIVLLPAQIQAIYEGID